ncbi:hypothetical protein WOLCODRAFT_147405 [Wolfiporia cocos MD-104 SS10]|uniref:Uncharacterized protein n=1 Tax=Wolfiporia cocos (strain MD-104) TaxID=742152 RepID=A0A2H3JBH9_WOLCO|nr:hypothetical protein WOLCODRAFT_147405 [Wolfiporia cocos MD-104 SS10]
MSDNQLMNTANRMIAHAVAALRAAPESMEGEDYTQWQTKFMEELAFNMGNFPYKVFELGYRLPELYGSMVAEYTQVRNDGEEFNKICVHEGDMRIVSIKNLAPTVDPTRPLPVVEDLGPDQWWTAEGSSTTQHATKKRGWEDSEEESMEKEGGKDDGSGGDEEEDNGHGGSEDDQQDTVQVGNKATKAPATHPLVAINCLTVVGLGVGQPPPARHSHSKGSNKGKGKKASKASGSKLPSPGPSSQMRQSLTMHNMQDSTNRMHYQHQNTGKILVPKKIEDGEFAAITGQEVYVIAHKFQEMYEDKASLPDNFNDLKVVCYDAEENDFIFDKRTLLSRKEKMQIAKIVAEKNAATQAGHKKHDSEEDEENEEDQMGRKEERLRHNDNTEMDGEGEVGPSAGPSTTRQADKGKQVPRWSTRVAEREHREASQAPQASVHVQAEQPSADNKGGYSHYRSQVGDDWDELLKAVTQMSGMLHQLIHKVDVLQETVHEMQVGQVGLQAQLEALRQVAMGVPLVTSMTAAPAPLTTSATAVPSLPAHLVMPPPMYLVTPPPVHFVTPPDAPHMPDMTLVTSATAVPSLPTRLATPPPMSLTMPPPVHLVMPLDASHVPDVTLATSATVAPATLTTSTTTAPAPLATSTTTVPSLPTCLGMPPPMHLVTPLDASHVPDVTLTTSATTAPAPLATSVTMVPSLPARLTMLPPTHLMTLPPVHSTTPPDAPDAPDVALVTAATVAPAPLANSTIATPVLSVTGNSMTSSTPASVVPPASEHAPMNDATDNAVHNEDVGPTDISMEDDDIHLSSQLDSPVASGQGDEDTDMDMGGSD